MKINNPKLLSMIRYIHQKLDGSKIDWVVTGSLGFAIHGIDVEIHDIDLQTDKNGVYEIERCFLQYVVQKVNFLETEKMKSYFGKLTIDGINVDIIGAIQKKLPDGSWENPVDIRKFREFVKFKDIDVPVLSLEYEAMAYQTLGRFDKVKLIKSWLSHRKDII